MYRLKIKKRTSLCILFLGMVIAVSAQGNKGDSLLTTLKNELKYNMEALQKQKKAPYFMSLRLQIPRPSWWRVISEMPLR